MKNAILAVCCLAVVAFAQGSFTRTYGGTGEDNGYSVQQTSDGGYIVAGNTGSRGAGLYDVWLIKTDAFGDTLWTRFFGGTGWEDGYSVQQTADRGYIIAGRTDSYGAGLYDVWLIKTDASGDTQWTRTWGGNYLDYGLAVRQTRDSGYIVAGYTAVMGQAGNACLLRFDTAGRTVWARSYGGASGEEYGNSVQQTSDGGYIVAGQTNSHGAGGYDFYLIKTDTAGETLWTRTFGGAGVDKGNCVQQTSDGGYIVAGSTESFGAGESDVYLVKTDAQGETLWTRTYGDAGYDWGYSVQQTSDSGYVVAGTWRVPGRGYDAYLIKTDDMGETLWTRTCGDTAYDFGHSVQRTADGGYIVAGSTASFGERYGDVYLIKTDSQGFVGVEERKPRTASRVLLTAEPSLFRSCMKLSCRLPAGSRGAALEIRDITGRKVMDLQPGPNDIRHIAPGVYFVRRPETEDGRQRTAVRKVVIQH
jgi:hypothetical protein